MAIELEKLLPTSRQVSDLMPPGRIAYVLVRQYLEIPDPYVTHRKREGAAKAIQILATGQKLGILEPPLTEDMAAAVTAVNDYSEAGGHLDASYYPRIDWMLEAVFEHGYRSDR